MRRHRESPWDWNGRNNPRSIDEKIAGDRQGVVLWTVRLLGLSMHFSITDTIRGMSHDHQIHRE